MPELRIGAARLETHVVGDDDAITFLGPAGSRVLSTPRMILYMEQTSRLLVGGMLDEGFATVGMHVDIWHRAAAPLGTAVTYKSELIGATARRCEFRVEARDGERLIGEGTHLRGIVETSKFAKT